jgi:hypothetical protein
MARTRAPRHAAAAAAAAATTPAAGAKRKGSDDGSDDDTGAAAKKRSKTTAQNKKQREDQRLAAASKRRMAAHEAFFAKLGNYGLDEDVYRKTPADKLPSEVLRLSVPTPALRVAIDALVKRARHDAVLYARDVKQMTATVEKARADADADDDDDGAAALVLRDVLDAKYKLLDKERCVPIAVRDKTGFTHASAAILVLAEAKGCDTTSATKTPDVCAVCQGHNVNLDPSLYTAYKIGGPPQQIRYSDEEDYDDGALPYYVTSRDHEEFGCALWACSNACFDILRKAYPLPEVHEVCSDDDEDTDGDADGDDD